MIKRWRSKFSDMKLASKMIVIYILVIGIFCGISLTALQLSLRIYDEKLYEKSIQELDFFTQKVNEELNSVEKLSYTIALGTENQQQLSKIKLLDYPSTEYSYEMYLYRSMLFNGMYINDIVKSITYTDGEKTTFTIGMASDILAGERLADFLKRTGEARGAYVTQFPTDDCAYLISGRDILKSIDSSLDYLGTLVFGCDIAGMIEAQRNNLEAGSAALYVYSESGTVYQSEELQDMKLPEIKGSQGYDIIQHKGQKYFMCYLESTQNGLTYVNVFPYSEIYGQTMQVRYFMIGCFLVLFLGTAFIMRKVSHIVTKPLEQLTTSMQIAEKGDFKGARVAVPESVRKDEVGLLTQEFQVMLDKIYVLIHENYEKQLLLKDTEYKMLQAQMNPHFLYNTLNAINWMVRASRNEDACKMVIELGELLRASFAKKHYATIESDVQLARNYITIQQFRYQKRVNFSLNTSGNLAEYVIPHMTIQPLVENCILYGVEDSINGCKVEVNVSEEEESILIEVIDDGPGMSKSELEQVRKFTAVPKGHGIGLRNIKERLAMTYEKSEFTIESEQGYGTAVRIRIPKKREEEVNV